MFKQSTLRSTLLLAGGIILTVVVLIASETGNIRLREAYSQVIQSQVIQADLNALTAELVDAEAGQRGYLLTGKESYLDPYYKAVPRIKALTSEIRARYANDSEGLKQFSEASQTISRKLTEMELTLIYGKRDFEVALDLVRTDYGKASMDKARTELRALQERAAGSVAHSVENADRDLNLSRYGIGLLTAINIALLVIVGFQHSHRLAISEAARSELEAQSAWLEHKVRERTRQLSALAAHLQRVTEQEKTRLARELHDELGAILTATKLDMHWIRRRIQETHPEAREKLTRVMQHIDEGIQIKRRLIEDLRPTILLNVGLKEAIEQLVQEVAARNNWEADVYLTDDIPHLRDEAAIALFRIAQEALTNATKYAEATELSITLDRDGDTLKMQIQDNGRGLPEDFATRSLVGHHGLLGMEQRMTALSGTLQIDSKPNEGVTIRVSVPLTEDIVAPPLVEDEEEPATASGPRGTAGAAPVDAPGRMAAAAPDARAATDDTAAPRAGDNLPGGATGLPPHA